MIKLILLPLAIAFVTLTTAAGVATGAIKTPLLDSKYQQNELIVDLPPATEEKSSVESDGTGNTVIVILEKDTNRYLKENVVGEVSVSKWVETLPDSLRLIVKPVLSLGGFEITSLNVTYLENEILLEGNLAKSNRVPFTAKAKVISTRTNDLDILITQASVGLVNIKGGNLSSLNTTVNAQVDEALKSVEGLDIESFKIESGKVIIQGKVPEGYFR